MTITREITLHLIDIPVLRLFTPEIIAVILKNESFDMGAVSVSNPKCGFFGNVCDVKTYLSMYLTQTEIWAFLVFLLVLF